MEPRTDTIYLVVESPTTHRYVAFREAYGNFLEEEFYSAKRAKLMTGRERIQPITEAELAELADFAGTRSDA